ncbi:hypothetical protein ACQ4PT_040670 [Festuca glaucescens]
MGAAATPSEPAGGDVRDDGAASSSSMNASAISFGFAATAILIAMFLLMAIFEHLIKPGWAASRASREVGGDGHAQEPSRSDRHRHRPRDDGSPSPDKLAPPPKVIIKLKILACSLAERMPPPCVRLTCVVSAATRARARRVALVSAVPCLRACMEAMVAVADLTVLMPGQRYPTFLAQPAPLLLPCPREPVRWPPHHDRRHSFLPS